MSKLIVNQSEVESVTGEDMSNSSIYLPECDSNGVPLLRRVEKYPDLSESEFIPIEYPEIKKGMYKINKLGQILRLKDNKILNGTITVKNYKQVSLLNINNKPKSYRTHRLVASTFLINPDSNIYDVVNHLDHNTINCNLSNLEWTTIAENSNKNSGRCSSISEDKLMSYIALDDQGNELFEINKYNNKGYDLNSVIQAVIKKNKYRKYYWKRSRLSKKEEALRLIGFSGNLDDYEWHEHWKYPGLYVCKEGFIRKNNKLLCHINEEGYVRTTIFYNGGKRNLSVHRIIMEFLLKRDLKDDEVVDHINTIRYDNRFENLRVTDLEGNMNNPLTLKKYKKLKIITDLLGNFLMLDYINVIYNKFLKLDSKNVSEKVKSSDYYSKRITINNKYFIIDLNNIDKVLKNMETVVYVISKDKTKVVGAYINCIEASKFEKPSVDTIRERIKDKKIAFDGNYYMRGSEAVKLILSLGYGTSLNYKKL